ncbi:MAG: hypothetical protein JRN15_16815, partial [Nitrososphaerota archaeon]|nr:hypothetical protein [Nitrososphaerota archaeon]
AGAELDLDRSMAISRNHDFIAAVGRKDDDKFEFFVSPSKTKVFDSAAALNDYLRALGLEEIGTIAPHTQVHQ